MTRFVDHITIDGKTYYTGTVFYVYGYWAGSMFDNFEVTFIAYDLKQALTSLVLWTTLWSMIQIQIRKLKQSAESGTTLKLSTCEI